MRWSILLLLFLVSCVEGTGELAPISGSSQDSPYITNVTIPSGTYVIGDNLLFTVTFSESVSVIGNPLLNFSTDSSTYSATYVGGSETRFLIFRFPVGVGMTDVDGIRVQSPLIPNSGNIFSVEDLEAGRLSFSSYKTGALISTGGGGGGTPFITGFTSSPASDQTSGNYERGMTYYIDVTFDQTVVVTGTPGMNVLIGTNDGTDVPRNLNYASGSGTPTLRFSGVVNTTDKDDDGVRLDTSTPQLTVNASNTIRSTVGVDANSGYTSPGAFANLLLDGNLGPGLDATNPPTVPVADVYRDTEVLEFTITFDRSVVVSGGTPHMDINIGGITRSAQWVSDGGVHTTIQRFTYTVGGNFDFDLDGVEVTGFSSNGSGFYDQYGASALTIQNTDVQNSSDALVAVSDITQWYDLARIETVSSGSTTTLVSFTDILATGLNGNLFGSIPYSQPSGYIHFSAADQYVTLNSAVNLNYVLLVINTDDGNSGNILYNDDATAVSLLNLSSGSYSAGACISRACLYLDSAGAWQNGNAITGAFSGISAGMGAMKVIAVNYNNLPSVLFRISNASTARIHEMVFVSNSATSAEVTSLANHLKAKHGASF